MGLVITAVNAITPVGHDAAMTAASIRAGISRLTTSEDYFDEEGNPFVKAGIEDIADEQEDEVLRMSDIAEKCLDDLLDNRFKHRNAAPSAIHLLLGVSTTSRPGPRYEGERQEIAEKLLAHIRKRAPAASLQVIAGGNPAVVGCIAAAADLLKQAPDAICIVGGLDSLLALDTLDWLEASQRLRTATFGRNQGLAPGEAVGFAVVEAMAETGRHNGPVLATIAGWGWAVESAPFVSDQPSKSTGLTQACRAAMSAAECNPTDIRHVVTDLDGEYFRSKEWGLTELRCFGSGNGIRQLWHPADCMGTVGAASGAVLLAVAVAMMSRVWRDQHVLIFCSDDEGGRGALVVHPPASQ